jgi:ABC-2 type transport system ATP-binding protein
LIEARDLKKSFGAIRAVDGISFTVQAGETFGLLGPNGAGKSTTIGMLVGLVVPDSGTVRVAGSDPSSQSTRKLLGVAPQSLSLYEELTARENLRFFGQLYGLRGARLNERVDWCLEFAGLTDRSRDHVATYSGGMKRRLNIAVPWCTIPKFCSWTNRLSASIHNRATISLTASRL